VHRTMALNRRSLFCISFFIGLPTDHEAGRWPL
jgi:hypothetical protein